MKPKSVTYNRDRSRLREADIAIEAIETLFQARQQVPYRSRAWWKLNNAMSYLDALFWKGQS